MGINETLSERGSRYGKFSVHAECTQRLKEVVYSYGAKLSPSQREALDMICHKIGRIVCGDPNYPDSWHDIAGYASLEDKILNGIEL